MKNENIVRILLLSIGAFLVFIGLFGGIIASGDFLSGGFSVVVGILFLSFSHKMKEIIKEQTIEKNEDATIGSVAKFENQTRPLWTPNILGCYSH